MSRWDALKPTQGESTDRRIGTTQRAASAGLAPTNQRWKLVDCDASLSSAAHATPRRSRARISDAASRNGAVFMARNKPSCEMREKCDHSKTKAEFDRSLRRLQQQLDRRRNDMRTERNEAQISSEEDVDVDPNDWLREGVRCSIQEFSDVLFRGESRERPAVSTAGERDSSTTGISAIALDAKGRAISLLFECADFLGRVEDDNTNEIVVNMCVFVSQLLPLGERSNCNREGTLVKMSDAKVDLCLKVVSTHLCLVLARMESNQAEGSDFLEETFAGALPLLKCLASILGHLGSQVKAEENAESVVRSVLLPILETANYEGIAAQHCSRQLHTLKCWAVAVDCIGSLLRMKQHASAILAPLVVDITEGGEERHFVNPLRARTTRSLQHILLQESDNDLLSRTCACLSSVLRAVSFIERSNQTKGTIQDGLSKQAADFNVVSVVRWISKLIERSGPCSAGALKGENTVRCQALALLASLAQTYPRATASQWSLFLQETYEAGSINGTNQKEYHRTSQLLSLIEPNVRKAQTPNEERVAALSATKEMINAMPLRLWFASTKLRNGGRSGHLVSRVRDPLISLLKGTCQLLKRYDKESDEVLVGLLTLAGAMMAAVPFEFDAFVKPASDLLGAVGDLLVKQMVGVNPNCTVPSVAAKTLADSVGGKLDQQGKLTPLLEPAREWLGGPKSDGFIMQVFSFIESNAASPCSDQMAVLQEISRTLSHVLRMAPWVPTKSFLTMKGFERAVCGTVESNIAEYRVLGATHAERFLHGRKDFFQEISEKDLDFSLVTGSLCPLLFELLSDTDALVRSRGLSAYGFLRGPEWEEMFGDNKLEAFHAVLGLCSSLGPESASTVRSEACKSVGNICSTCISKAREEVKEPGLYAAISDSCVSMICGEVTAVMLTAVKDPHSSVRSMALFAIGNLALALKERRSAEVFIPTGSFLELCYSVQNCLGDRNEKVVGNAIRTIGHICWVLFQGPCYKHTLGTGASEMYKQITRTLSNKMKTAIADATQPSLQRSWKQRSYAKKHAKGAATSLSFLLCGHTARAESNREYTQAALINLMKCVEKMGVLDDKVTGAAVSTLKSTPVEIWRLFSGENTVLGHGLVLCMVVMFEANDGRRKIPTDVDDWLCSFLSMILSVSTVSDISECLASGEVSSCTVDFLYNWMVSRECRSREFESVALALQSRSLNKKYDVSATQKFLSRAAYEQKRLDAGDEDVETRSLSYASTVEKSEGGLEDEL